MLPWVDAVQNIRTGWHYNLNLNVFQKTENKCYVYVTRLISGYCVQLYLRGAVKNSNYCLVELRTDNHSKENLEKMFKYGERWLSFYSDGNEEKILKDQFSTYNPKGVWGSDRLPEKGYLV